MMIEALDDKGPLTVDALTAYVQLRWRPMLKHKAHSARPSKRG